MSKVTTHTITPGDRFGRGVVLEEIRIPVTRADRTNVRGARLTCDCGTVYEVAVGDLLKKAGSTKSCGCMRREGNHTSHGLSRHGGQTESLYRTWCNMMARCYNPRVKEFRYYGARGIEVCERWHDVRLFIEDIGHLLGPRPDGCTLDRWPDNSGPYAAWNVRWATQVEQIRNSSLYIDGRTRHPLYAGWLMMVKRHTGEVCESWRDFWTFADDIERALGPRPGKLVFRRIDLNGTYEPGNVCWGRRPGRPR